METVKPKQFISLFLLTLLAACIPGLPASPRAAATSSPTFHPTLNPESTPIPTETLVPTATEKLPAQDIWQVSPDKHIVYNETKLVDGKLTINTEHPEYTLEYWKSIITGIHNLNVIGKNTSFTDKFPTAQSLIDYLNSPDSEPITNLLIPVIYPNSDREFAHGATLVTIDSVNLSQIAIQIENPSREEIMKYTGKYPNTEFISFWAGSGEILVKKHILTV
jgi:hypothetical protein